jgi:hypothetical protein
MTFVVEEPEFLAAHSPVSRPGFTFRAGLALNVRFGDVSHLAISGWILLQNYAAHFPVRPFSQAKKLMRFISHFQLLLIIGAIALSMGPRWPQFWPSARPIQCSGEQLTPASLAAAIVDASATFASAATRH